jgi:hypothetical protein
MDNSFEEMLIHIEVLHRLARREIRKIFFDEKD